MFSGIITEIGFLKPINFFTERSLGGKKQVRIKVFWSIKNFFKCSIGDSVSVNGVCLTIVSKGLNYFEADVSNETLDVTVGLDKPGSVNLEFPLRVGGSLGGHMVSGHVDGIAKLSEIMKSRDSRELSFITDEIFYPMVTKKGSIAINGVSLTVNEVDLTNHNCRFLVNLIPHTLMRTTLSNLTTDSIVNIELDPIAKMVDQFLSVRREQENHRG